MRRQLRTDVSLTVTDIGAVILDEVSGGYWQLNDTGARLLTGMLDGESDASLVEVLVAEYEVDAEQAQFDVHALIDSLVRAGLLR